jgi:hypothetical protein
VVRVDHYAGSDGELANRITLKEIVPTIEEAEAEVTRLQELQPRDEVEYFVAGGNFFPEGRGAKSEY